MTPAGPGIEPGTLVGDERFHYCTNPAPLKTIIFTIFVPVLTIFVMLGLNNLHFSVRFMSVVKSFRELRIMGKCTSRHIFSRGGFYSYNCNLTGWAIAQYNHQCVVAVGNPKNGDVFPFLPVKFQWSILKERIIRFLRRLTEGYSRFVNVKISKSSKQTGSRVHKYQFQMIILRSEIRWNPRLKKMQLAF